MKFLIFATLLLLLLAFHYSDSHRFEIINNCPFTIWPGIINNPEKYNGTLPEKGGFKLEENEVKKLNLTDGWAGRIWARTGCENGHCETGDCGKKIECSGSDAVPPVSFADITLDDSSKKQDLYFVDLTKGFNLPIKIMPIEATYQKHTGSEYECEASVCHADLNKHCPKELALKKSDRIIACQNPCLVFDTDQYCCRGKFNTRETCKSSEWPKDYTLIFKDSCPDAFSYRFDDETKTFFCQRCPWENTGYRLTFCPQL